ncbi:MAG: hypothetical protein JXQ90_00480 [Cyclobacteriaceae bacterium]
MNTYTFFLHLHSGLRWLILLIAVAAIVKSIIGVTQDKPFGKLDNILGASFAGTMHLQLLVGLVLYIFLSPITKAAFKDFGAAMKNSDLREYAVEHIFIMILVAVLATIGRSKAKKSTEDARKFRMQLIFFGAALVLMLISIPWDRL